MSKIVWKDYRRNVRYVINAAFADLPDVIERPDSSYKPTFTIASQHKDGLYSMEQLFMEHYTDPTEYSFVQDVFEGDVKHWEEFKNGRYIRPYYEKWKSQAEGKLMSEAMGKIVATAFDENNRSSFQALKYLVERNEKPSTKPGRGRPKKEKEAPQSDDKLLLDAIARIKE